MGSTDLHEDYIFLTQNHDHASTKAIWLVKRYDPDTYTIQFYKVEPDDKVGIISIHCIPVDETNTQIEVTYQYIGISEKGDEFTESFSTDKYSDFMDEWKKLLRIYFESNGNSEQR
jgi:hypothetical protein